MVMRAFLAGRSISTRDGGVLELGLQVVAHLDVFGQHAGEVTVAGVPALAQLRLTEGGSRSGWIFCPMVFLAFPWLPTVTYTWHVGFLMRLPRPLARAAEALEASCPARRRWS